MALDIGPGVTSGARSDGTPSASTATSSTAGELRGTPRVIAVLHASSAEHLVPALAGATAQSHRPDLLIAVNSVPGWKVAGTAVPPPAPSPAARAQAKIEAEAAAAEDLSLTGELFAAVADDDPGDPDHEPGDRADEPVDRGDEPGGRGDDESTGAMAAIEFDDLTDTPVPRTPPSVFDVLTAHCDAVLPLPSAGLNLAVETALRWADGAEGEPDESGAAGDEPGATSEDWIWLLDDHDRPDPKALDRLLDQVRVSTTVTVVGAKHRGGPGGRELLDVGLTTSRFGRVMTFTDPGEPDQGQRDHVRDTLAVGLSGMLIRRDVWTALRGLDPALEKRSETDAAVDLCRRAWLAGGRVEVAPAAVLTCLQDDRHGVSRRARTHRRLAGAPLLAVPFVALSVVVGALLRLLAGIAAKEPVRAAHHAGASLVPLLRPDQVLRARWRAWRSHRIARRRLTPLLAGAGQTLRWHRDRAQRSLPRLVSPAGRDAAGPWSALALGLLLLAAGVVALLRILPDGPFSSAAWPGIGDGVFDTAAAWWSSWVPTGLGAAGPADPLLAVLAVLGAPFGSPQTAVRVLLVAGPAFAALSAWWAAGALTRRRGVRVAAALGWAASPVALLAVSGARVSLVLTLIFLPVAVRAVGQAVAAPVSRSSLAWAAAGGLALAAATTGPALLTLLLAAIVLLAAARSRRPGVVFAAVPPLLMALPSLLAARYTPALLVAEPGSLVHRQAPPGWNALLGWAEPPGSLLGSRLAGAQGWLEPLIGAPAAQLSVTIAPYVLGALPLLMAVGALRVSLRGSPRGAVCRAGWLIAAAGVLFVYLAPRLIVGVDANGPVRGSAATGTVLTLLGLCVAGVSGWGPRRTRRTGFWAGTGRAIFALVCLIALLPAVVSVAAWTLDQQVSPAAGDVRPGANPPLPAVVIDAATSPDQVRVATITVQGDGGLRVGLVRQEGYSALRESAASTVRTTAEADSADQALAAALAQVSAGTGDARTILAPFGVGAVVLLPGEAGTAATKAQTAALAGDLDSTLGLSPVGEVDGVRAWRVDSISGSPTAADRPAAVRLVPANGKDNPGWFAVPSSDGTVDADVTVQAGTLHLGERYDSGWHASLDGVALKAVRVDGWGQGFQVPAGTGQLLVDHDGPWQDVIGWAQLAVLALALLIALPVRSRDERRSRR